MGSGALLRRGRVRPPTIRAHQLGAGCVGASSLSVAPRHRVQVRPMLDEAWSKRGHLTVYDALYVGLAEHLNATLVTGDLRLARSPQLNVTLIVP